MNLYMPVRLYTGENCIRSNRSVLKQFGNRALLITGKHSAQASGALRDVLDILHELGITTCVFDGISPNPTVESCILAGKAARAHRADFLIGIGGGSALDAAKAAAVFSAAPELDEEGFYAGSWSRALPIVLCGTTAGTGSEVTKVSVLTDSRGRKHSIHHDLLYACTAFADPRYTCSQPHATTLSAGIDIVAHCTESWFSRKATPYSRCCAAEGIRLAVEPLLAVSRGEQLCPEQRALLYDAALLGGLAINLTGTCFPHNVGYYLTERFGVPHGFACAAFLPELLEHVSAQAPELSSELYRVTGTDREKLLSLVRQTLPEYHFELSEADIETALPRWENNSSVRNTVGEVSTDEIRNMLLKFRKVEK